MRDREKKSALGLVPGSPELWDLQEFIISINSYLKRVVYRLNPRQSDDGDHSETQATPPCPSAPLLPSKLINSGLPSCQIFPLASIPFSENLATVSPGSSLPNKQTNCPATVPVPCPGTARQGCAPPLPTTSHPLQPIEPGLWRLHPAPIAGHSLLCPSLPYSALQYPRGLLVKRVQRAPPPLVGPLVAHRPGDLPRGSRLSRRWSRLSSPLPPPLHTSAGCSSRPSTGRVAGASATAA